MENNDKNFLTRLKEYFKYNEGTLVQESSGLDKSWSSVRGYRRIMFEKKTYLLHRLIFFYFNGYFPKVVDHIDGNLLNNSKGNLQGCDQRMNIEKAAIFKTNKTGYKGVSFNKPAKNYEAYFFKDYKKHYLGLFNTAEEASIARMKGKYGQDL
jgi:hypothetical protein